MSSLPTVVFACDLFTLCYAMSAIFNTVSLHSTVFDHCTVHYGTGRVGRYGNINTYLNTHPIIQENTGTSKHLFFSLYESVNKNIVCCVQMGPQLRGTGRRRGSEWLWWPQVSLRHKVTSYI